MSLLRDSAIVGAATFLIGSVFMGISVKQEGEPVGWWPYVGTFMSGALGFYLLAATNVVNVKNAEGLRLRNLEHHKNNHDNAIFYHKCYIIDKWYYLF